MLAAREHSQITYVIATLEIGFNLIPRATEVHPRPLAEGDAEVAEGSGSPDVATDDALCSGDSDDVATVDDTQRSGDSDASDIEEICSSPTSQEIPDSIHDDEEFRRALASLTDGSCDRGGAAAAELGGAAAASSTHGVPSPEAAAAELGGAATASSTHGGSSPEVVAAELGGAAVASSTNESPSPAAAAAEPNDDVQQSGHGK